MSNDCEHYRQEIDSLLRQTEALEDRIYDLERDLSDAQDKCCRLEEEVQDLTTSNCDLQNEAQAWESQADYYYSLYDEAKYHLENWEKVEEETGYGPEDVLEWFRDIKAQVELRVDLMKQQGVNPSE